MNLDHPKYETLSWQGWQMRLPPKWSPVKLEGDYQEGHALFADLLRPRMGLRWKLAGRKNFDAATWAMQSLQAEVGRLAADEAQPLVMATGEWPGSTIYIEADPPGRDVWLGQSLVSNRVIEVTYHAHRRDRMLADTILPTLVDLNASRSMPWSVFHLRCLLPPGWKLETHRLHAGDLSLAFSRPGHKLSIRQVAMATLALARMPMDAWLLDQQKADRKYFRPEGPITDTTMEIGGRTIDARMSRSARRTRFFMLASVPKQRLTLAGVDVDEDRIVIVQGTDEAVVRQVASSVGAGQQMKQFAESVSDLAPALL